MPKTLPIKEKHARRYAQLQTVQRPDTGNELIDALQEWDRKMQQAFKGIYTRRQRHRAMQRAGL